MDRWTFKYLTDGETYMVVVTTDYIYSSALSTRVPRERWRDVATALYIFREYSIEVGVPEHFTEEVVV